MTASKKPIVRKLESKRDERGWLLKLLMRHHIGAANREFGEIYLTAAHSGQVKGNHYHRQAREWFCLIQGRARLVTQDLETGELTEFAMSADDPSMIEVPPLTAHAVQCVGDDLAVLFAYADQPYDADNPDEVRWPLIEPVDATATESTSQDGNEHARKDALASSEPEK